MERQQADLIPTLILIFNRKRTFYKSQGAGGYWNGAVSPNEVRVKLEGEFLERGGFDLLCRTMRGKKIGWLGAENTKVLLQAVVEGREVVGERERRVREGQQQEGWLVRAQTMARATENVLEEVVACLKEPLGRVGEEELKKEPGWSMSNLVDYVKRKLCEAEEEGDQEVLLQFWLALAHAHIRSSSLPLRLSAWEKMGDIFKITKENRPFAKSY